MLLHRLRPPDAVGDADAPQPVQPGIGVGGEPGVVLAGHAHEPDRAVLDHLVERQHVVAGDPEDVLDPQRVQPVDQVLADGRHGRLGVAVASRRRCGDAGHELSPGRGGDGLAGTGSRGRPRAVPDRKIMGHRFEIRDSRFGDSRFEMSDGQSRIPDVRLAISDSGCPIGNLGFRMSDWQSRIRNFESPILNWNNIAMPDLRDPPGSLPERVSPGRAI